MNIFSERFYVLYYLQRSFDIKLSFEKTLTRSLNCPVNLTTLHFSHDSFIYYTRTDHFPVTSLAMWNTGEYFVLPAALYIDYSRLLNRWLLALITAIVVLAISSLPSLVVRARSSASETVTLIRVVKGGSSTSRALRPGLVYRFKNI